MADTLLHLEIITPGKQMFSEEVDSVEAPGIDGDFQVFAGHTPFLTRLRIGQIVIWKEGTKTVIPITGGFFEVKASHAVVLAHAAEQISGIDRERAEEAKARAQKRLEEAGKDSSINEERAKLALMRAINRINALDQAGSGLL